MKAAFDTSTEGMLRERIRRLETTLAAYDRAVNTQGVDYYRKQVAVLQAALTDAVIPIGGGDAVKRLEQHGLSRGRATEIYRLLTGKMRL